MSNCDEIGNLSDVSDESIDKRINYLESLRVSVNNLFTSLSELCEVYILEKSKRWLTRKWWRRPFLQEKQTKGFMATTWQDLKADPDYFFMYTRMDVEIFNHLLDITKPKFNIQRNRSDGVSAEEHLVLTLRFYILY